MKVQSMMVALVTGMLALFASGCGQVVPPGSTCMRLSSDGEMEVVSQGVVVAWFRDRLYLVDTKVKSYDKPVSVLCNDQIPMEISLKWIGSFKSDEESLTILRKKYLQRTMVKLTSSVAVTCPSITSLSQFLVTSCLTSDVMS